MSMSTIQRIGDWVGHLVNARSLHGVHSPFIYQLSAQVLRRGDVPPDCLAIEQLRDDLLDSDQTIMVNDLGAGSQVMTSPARRVSDIARTALKSQREAVLLYNLARFLRPTTILELGTSFGLSTLYLARGAPEARVYTIEGCPQTHRIAQHHFELLKQGNIEPVLGSFRTRLPDVMGELDRLDLAFIDGHHEETATLDYVEKCLGHAHEGTLIIVDDIHWSRGMREAWRAIKDHPKVTITVDLFKMGLVFLRTEQAPQHFKLRI